MKANQVVVLLGSLVVLGVGAYLFQVSRQRAAVDAQMAQLVSDVEAAAAARPLDTTELSRLWKKVEAADATDPRVALCFGKIELARGRWERAANALEPRIGIGSDDLPALRAGAEAYMMWAARGGKDAGDRAVLARRALQLAESAFQLGGTAEDAFACWQCGVRLPDEAVRKRYLDVLQERFADSLQARTASTLAKTELDQPLRPLQDLVREWNPPPVELSLGLAVLELQNQEIEASHKRLEELLSVAPSLLEVRNWAATVFHVLAVSSQGDARNRFVSKRDAQLDWLMQNAAPEDARRAKWSELRQVR
jgi:hypothetical protein